jgi:hypothetical protein
MNYLFDCAACLTPCDGKTVPQFDFEKDVAFAEKFENQIISKIIAQYPFLSAEKTSESGYPDIVVKHQLSRQCIAYIEVKGQARTFMKIQTFLPHSQLFPSETVALNLSDLERYFQIKAIEKKPLYIVWCLLNRPCIVPENKQKYFHQEIDILQKIRQQDTNNTRRFRRKSGSGDVVNGEHKGVTVNYHFSLQELIGGLPALADI